MRKIKINTCGRCGSAPKVTLNGVWYKVFCPNCHMGRSRHACDNLEWVIECWNICIKRVQEVEIKSVTVEIQEVK